MAICVSVTVNDLLEIDNSSLASSCPQYVLVDSTEFNSYQNVVTGTSNTITFQDVFEIPDATVLADAFELGFTIVMICFLTTWALGTIINWFQPEHDRY